MTKHQRKLKKRAAKLEKRIRKHELFKNWSDLSVKTGSNKICLLVTKPSDYRDGPDMKRIEIGLKENLNIERFLGKFREPSWHVLIFFVYCIQRLTTNL